MLGIGVSLRHLRGTTAGGFSPAALFAGGEVGVWYEPGPTTAFKSTTDLTPCAAGDSCGFLLDQSKGAGYSGGAFTGLGSEIFTDFTNEGEWVDNGNGSWTVNSATNSTDLRVDYSGTIGKYYLLTFAISTSANLLVYPLNTTPGFNGSGSYRIVSLSNVGFFIFRAAVGTTATVSNISVRELPGNHATQATAAARPLLQSGSPDYLRDDLVDDALNWTAPADTDYTIARLNSAGIVTILTEQSLSGATDILLEQDVAGYVAVDRALTSQETTDLAAYLEALT